MMTLRKTCASLLLLALATSTVLAEQTNNKPTIAILLADDLARVEDTEIRMSRVHIPPNMSLPKHWHPGEEFVYVIEGQVTLWREGKESLVFSAGDAGKVSLKQIHTAISGDEGVDLVVFRVHEKGQPERVLSGGP